LTKSPLAIAGKGVELNFRSTFVVVWDYKSLDKRCTRGKPAPAISNFKVIG